MRKRMSGLVAVTILPIIWRVMEIAYHPNADRQSPDRSADEVILLNKKLYVPAWITPRDHIWKVQCLDRAFNISRSRPRSNEGLASRITHVDQRLWDLHVKLIAIVRSQ